ncbi:testis-expressed protein 2-like isoform X2 [Hyla sarda]|uniref:testis-expressed protein 2-like isoform X2 n=1 Tax=Hyla sarda TaxID=327740 RepID=UPI0024C24EDD|nr:testis-expressed protein 2-like isoform X2 [Hyla sarda]
MSNSAQDSPVPTGSPKFNNSLPGPKHGLVTQQTPQGITIQLTKVHSEDNWEDLDESELIFTLDQDEEGAVASTIAGRITSPVYGPLREPDGTVIDELAQAAYECAGDVLLSGDTQKQSFPLLPNSPTSKPLINLVKSVSTEIDVKDPTLPKPHPFVNLVKSISTEISRLEPEVTQSKSDSKLNVHLWRQITQPKSRNGDSRTAPSSPSTSPSESKGMFFNVQDVEAKLEDTKRRLSEAMQEPLSMLSKIIGEETTSPTPKYRTMSPLFLNQDSPSSQLKDQGSFESKNMFTNYGRLEEGEIVGFVDPSKGTHKEVPKNHCKYKICSYGDVIQVVELTNDEDTEDPGLPPANDDRQSPSSNNDVPCSVLVCVTILAYNFFIWPLPAYISGLFMGIASGFILGFFLVLLLVPKHSCSRRHKRYLQECAAFPLTTCNLQEPTQLQGWMNEMFLYDPETYHPALTHSVFVMLEGTTLKRCYPKISLPRRSIYGEEIAETVFVSHQTNNLANAQVFLYPDGLANKRLWNKKYPICIQLSDPDNTEVEHEEPADRETENGENPRRDPDSCQKSSGECKTGTLYLFGRTGREKEEWHQHLVRASQGSMAGKEDANRGSLPNPLSSPCSWGGTSNSSVESTEDTSHMFKPKDLAGNVRQKILLDYDTYMSRFIATEPTSPAQSPQQSTASSPTPSKKHPMEQSLSSNLNVCWINAFIGRIFWDFLREKYWEDAVANKIQKKLTKIKLPNFMNELTLAELDMGTSLPQILSISTPSVNERGLWVDMEVTYSGSLQVTLETKMNLSRLGKETTMDEGGSIDNRRLGAKRPRSNIFTDSDEESSSAGSSEDEEIIVTETPGNLADRVIPNNAESFTGGNSTSRRILRFVDKIAKSRYFQKATENEYIKRKIEEVSNTPLLLTVELQELEGTLAVNIPPPPTDRIWYSFRSPPQVEMKVRPKLGEREVTFIHVTEWIEKKLQDEFQKILVMPNMDDLLFPIMQSGLDPTRPPQTDQSMPVQL